MAIYNEILNARYAKALTKIFGMKGGNPAKQLAGELSSTHSFFSGVENRPVEQWNRYGSTAAPNAVAAQNTGMEFRNPVASGAIAVIESLLIASGIASEMAITRVGLITTDYAQLAPIAALDGRQPNGASVAIVSQGNNVANTGTVIHRVELQANISTQVITFEDQEIPVPPGQALQFIVEGSMGGATTVNVAANACFIWRERVLEDSEKTGL